MSLKIANSKAGARAVTTTGTDMVANSKARIGAGAGAATTTDNVMFGGRQYSYKYLKYKKKYLQLKNLLK